MDLFLGCGLVEQDAQQLDQLVARIRKPPAFGHRAEAMLGTTLTRIMPERYRQAHCRALAEVTRTGRSHLIGKSVQVYGLRADGSEFPLELSLSTWQTGEGRFFTGIIHSLGSK